MTSRPPAATPHSTKALRYKLIALGCVIVTLLLLAAAWSWSPLRQWLDIDRVVAALHQLGTAYGPFVAALGFACALTVMVPLTFLTLVTIVAFGPTVGVACSIVGALAGSMSSYGMGVVLGRDVVRRMGGPRVNALSQRLASRGMLAVVFVRLVPIAPFALVNMIAGASHIRLRDLLLGTLVGMLPGALGMAYFVDPLIEMLRQPERNHNVVIGVSIAVVGCGMFVLRRWLRSEK